MEKTLTCANHPKVETNLRCGRCDRPICTACMVQSPVGIRCRECARLKRLPTYELSSVHYLRAMAVAVGLGLVLGVGWSLFRGFPILGFYLSFLIALAIGYAMGEVVSLSVNRKRGRGLQVVAGVGVFISYLASRMPLLALAAFPGLAPASLAASLVGALFDPFGLLMAALGIFMAVGRLR